MTDIGVSFHVTEAATGRERVYRKSKLGKLMPTVTDTQAFPCDTKVPLPNGESSLEQDPTTHPILNERFQIEGQWQSQTGQGAIQGIALTRYSTAFSFFSPSNIELVIKVLDGCANNGHHWIFMAGLTDVKFDLWVKDMKTGKRWQIANPQGQPFGPVRDLTAFPCSTQ